MAGKRKRSTDVSLRLAKQVLLDEEYKDSNVVLSPLSINALLGLVAAGSEGATLGQFLHFLDCETVEDINSLSSKLFDVCSDKGDRGGALLNFASGVWVDQSLVIKPSFKQIVNNVHQATLLKKAFFQTKAEEVTKEVNLWVERETNGLIKEALPLGTINGLTRLVLANALYFKGAWVRPFEPLLTANNDFHLLNGSTVRVPFMTNCSRYRYLGVYDGFKVMEFPYKFGADTRRFSMCIYLPDRKNGLPALIKKLTAKPNLLDSYSANESVTLREFRIPKFKISFGFEASKVLKKLGLVMPFSPEDAELTKMVDSPDGEPIYVTDIFHQSIIEVNERGTEVAAASTLKLCGGGDTSMFPDFVADHPFLFTIREDTSGVLLFIGSVVDPSAD